MGNSKVKANYTFPQVIIMSDNSNLIKNKVEVDTIGLENNQIFMKENLRQEKEMEEELSGGLMVVGMKENSRMESNVGMGCCIGMVDR